MASPAGPPATAGAAPGPGPGPPATNAAGDAASERTSAAEDRWRALLAPRGSVDDAGELPGAGASTRESGTHGGSAAADGSAGVPDSESAARSGAKASDASPPSPRVAAGTGAQAQAQAAAPHAEERGVADLGSVGSGLAVEAVPLAGGADDLPIEVDVSAWRRYARETARAHGVDVEDVADVADDAVHPRGTGAGVKALDGAYEAAYWTLLQGQVPAEVRILRDVRRTFAAFEHGDGDDGAADAHTAAGASADAGTKTLTDAETGTAAVADRRVTGDDSQQQQQQQDRRRRAMAARVSSVRSLVLKADSLRRSLCALSVHDPELGYCQGMNFVVALALEALGREEDAFWLSVRLMSPRFLDLRGLYMDSVPALANALTEFEAYASVLVPDLMAHLDRQGFAPALYAVEWMTTLFAVSMRTDGARAVVSMMLDGIESVLVRVGTAALLTLRSQLLRMRTEALMQRFKDMVRRVSPRHLLCLALCLPTQAAVADSAGASDTDGGAGAARKGVRQGRVQDREAAGRGARSPRGAATRGPVQGRGGDGSGYESEGASRGRSRSISSATARAVATITIGDPVHGHAHGGARAASSGGAAGAVAGSSAGRTGSGGGADPLSLGDWSGVDVAEITGVTLARAAVASARSRPTGALIVAAGPRAGTRGATATGSSGRPPVPTTASRASSAGAGAGAGAGADGGAASSRATWLRADALDGTVDRAVPAAPQVAVTDFVRVLSYVTYTVQVSAGTRTWVLMRRYSEFRALYDDLERAYPDVEPELPSPPPKQWIGTETDAFVAARCAALDRFMRHLCAHPILLASVTLWSFLEPDRGSMLPAHSHTRPSSNAAAHAPRDAHAGAEAHAGGREGRFDSTLGHAHELHELEADTMAATDTATHGHEGAEGRGVHGGAEATGLLAALEAVGVVVPHAGAAESPVYV